MFLPVNKDVKMGPNALPKTNLFWASYLHVTLMQENTMLFTCHF